MKLIALIALSFLINTQSFAKTFVYCSEEAQAHLILKLRPMVHQTMLLHIRSTID